MPKTLAFLIAAALLGPVGAVKAGRVVADRVGTALGQEFAAAAAELPRLRSARTPPANLFSDAAVVEFVEPVIAAPPPAAPRRGARAGKRVTAPSKPRRGIFVSAASVLRLAQAAAMPNAVPVPAAGPRPAGLRLVGVGGLGIGMRDGDVLTRVFGAPATSVAAVVQGVIAARARHAREISAEFWRDGAAWSLVVQQPYLEANSPP